LVQDDDKKAGSNGSKTGDDDALTTVIDIVLVQPKSLQECRIVYDDALQTMAKAVKIEDENDGEEVKIVAAKTKDGDNAVVVKQEVVIKQEVSTNE